jgi:hypothetical protein
MVWSRQCSVFFHRMELPEATGPKPIIALVATLWSPPPTASSPWVELIVTSLSTRREWNVTSIRSPHVPGPLPKRQRPSSTPGFLVTNGVLPFVAIAANISDGIMGPFPPMPSRRNSGESSFPTFLHDSRIQGHSPFLDVDAFRLVTDHEPSELCPLFVRLHTARRCFSRIAISRPSIQTSSDMWLMSLIFGGA